MQSRSGSSRKGRGCSCVRVMLTSCAWPAADWKKRRRGPYAVRWQQADVSVLHDVTVVVERAIAEFGGLDVLVCNAGVHGPKGPIEDVDWHEWVQALNINLCGSVLCCRAVLPHFRAQRSGKIILLSGGGATKPMPFLSAYAASKAAVVRFCETLAGEVKDAGIDVNAVAPGALNTRLLDDVLEAGPERVGQVFYEQLLAQKRRVAGPSRPPPRCARFLLHRKATGSPGV